MDLPAVLTGTPRINQTVGKTQPAIPDSTAISLALFMGVLHSAEPLPFCPPTENATILLLLLPPLYSAIATHLDPSTSILPFFLEILLSLPCRDLHKKHCSRPGMGRLVVSEYTLICFTVAADGHILHLFATSMKD